MPRAYPPEFRARAIALVRAGKPQKQTAQELDIHPVTLSKWVKQDRVETTGGTTTRRTQTTRSRNYVPDDRRTQNRAATALA